MKLFDKIKSEIDKYFIEKKWWQIGSDFLFVVLLIALLIPQSRSAIIVPLRKLTLREPKAALVDDVVKLKSSDFDWLFQTSTGEVINFAQLKGKTVFLSFWSTTCPHCIAEMPAIESLYKKYRKDINFVLLTYQSPQTVEKFVKAKGFHLPYSYTYGNIPSVFDPNVLPTSFLISPSGEIVISKVGAARWDGCKTRKIIDNLIKNANK